MKNISELYDLHAHILPGVDDGCRDCAESLQILSEMKRQGICGAAATPHYYPKESVAQFLARREAAIGSLELAIRESKAEVPQLCYGAEVAYREGISREDELEQLCLGHSRYILLELPFARWEAGVFRDLEIISQVRGLIPIIAHIERYLHYQDHKTRKQLSELNLLIQMNAEYYLDPMTRRKARKLIKKELVQVLGSDTHNVSHRPPNLAEGIVQMRNDRVNTDEMEQMNRMIFTSSVR